MRTSPFLRPPMEPSNVKDDTARFAAVTERRGSRTAARLELLLRLRQVGDAILEMANNRRDAVRNRRRSLALVPERERQPKHLTFLSSGACVSPPRLSCRSSKHVIQ